MLVVTGPNLVTLHCHKIHNRSRDPRRRSSGGRRRRRRRQLGRGYLGHQRSGMAVQVQESKRVGRQLPPHRPPRSVSLAASISFSSARKPPEPLRRAVADCLSPPAPHTHTHAPPPAASSAPAEASRTLRVIITTTPSLSLSPPFFLLLIFCCSCCQDYIANPSTIDMAYNVLIDHALAERDRRYAFTLLPFLFYLI